MAKRSTNFLSNTPKKQLNSTGKRNYYWSDMTLNMETAARLGDNRKAFFIAIITRRTINEWYRIAKMYLLRILRIAS